MNILQETISMLQATDESFAVIARECQVSTKWVYRLAKGEYFDPGVMKVHRVHSYLTRSKGKAA